MASPVPSKELPYGGFVHPSLPPVQPQGSGADGQEKQEIHALGFPLGNTGDQGEVEDQDTAAAHPHGGQHCRTESGQDRNPVYDSHILPAANRISTPKIRLRAVEESLPSRRLPTQHPGRPPRR